MNYRIEPYDANISYIQVPIRIPIRALDLFFKYAIPHKRVIRDKEEYLTSSTIRKTPYLDVSTIPFEVTNKIFSTYGDTIEFSPWFEANYQKNNKVIISGKNIRSPKYYGDTKYAKYLEKPDIFVAGERLAKFLKIAMRFKPIYKFMDYE